MFVKLKGFLEQLLDDLDIRHFLRNYNHTVNESLGAKLQGIYTVQQFRDGVQIAGFAPEPPNLFVEEGIHYIQNLVLGNLGKTAAYGCYLGLGRADVTPLSTYTAANSLGGGNLLEALQSSGHLSSPSTNRPTFTPGAPASGVISNSASPASFTIGASFGTTCYTTFCTIGQTQGSTTGALLSAKRLDPVRTVSNNDILNIIYSVTITSS